MSASRGRETESRHSPAARLRGMVASLAGAALCAAATWALAAPPIPPPPPVHVAVPPPGKGAPDQAEKRLPAGYIEEEFIVSGTGRLFAYDAEGEAAVKASGVPWATRVLVRRPADPAKFSGWVLVEPMHPELGRPFAWRNAGDYLGRKGDAWVGITTTRNLILYGDGDPISRLQRSDPQRYAWLGFGPSGNEGGLNWDVIAAVGQAVKAGKLTGPLAVKKTLVGGWSGSGALTIFFTNTFHMRERMADGGPIFDAVLIGEPGWYPPINADSGSLIAYDARQRPAMLDVPTISVNSSAPIEFGMPFRPRADSDDARNRFRAYEVAGADHRGTRDPTFTNPKTDCGAPASDFPLHYYYSLAVDHLKRWSDEGKAPPPSQPIAIDRYGYVVTDASGNPVGGVRSPYLDVPVARYYQTHAARLIECRGGGRMDLFGPAELRKRYRSHAGYVARVKARADELVRAGWLMPEDAAETVAKAQAFKGFEGR